MAGAVGAIGGIVAAPIAAHFAQKRAFKYQKKMMKNKWQWEVADLIAAGLNPILGYTKGGPGVSSPGIPNMGLAGAGSTALSAVKLRSELDLLRSTAERNRADASRAAAAGRLSDWQSKKVELEVEEFKPTVGGVGRRLLESKRVQDFIKKVGPVMRGWISDRMRNAAERDQR